MTNQNDDFKIDYDKKILEVKNLRQYFKVGSGKNKIIVKAVDDVNFEIYSKEVFGLVGESGSGKTTTGRTIIGLYKATGGKVIYNDDIIGYGIDSIIFDIKKIKKQQKLDILFQNPYKKALYDLKQNYLEAVNKIQAEINAIENNVVEINLAQKPITDYENLVHAIRREEKLKLADLEKKSFLQKSELDNDSYKAINNELKSYLIAAKKRFNKKYAYLKDAKLNPEAKKNQFNNFLGQFISEIDFTYEVLERKIVTKDEFKYLAYKHDLFKKGQTLIGKFLKNKLIDPNNISEINDTILKLSSLKNDFKNVQVLGNPNELEKQNKSEITKIENQLEIQTNQIEKQYEAKIKELSLPDTEAVNQEVVRINAEKTRLIAIEMDKLIKLKDDYKVKTSEIRADQGLKAQPVNQMKVDEILTKTNEMLRIKYEELSVAKQANAMKETPEAKKVRKAKLKELKENLKLTLENASEVDRVRLTDEYNLAVEKIQSEIPSYANVLSSMQMIFQDPISSLNPRMTVREIIGEGLKIKGVKDKAEIERKTFEVLSLVGLQSSHADRYPHEFSGGQRQRIGIARALIINPKFIIADEPISALDVSIQAQIINLLNDLKHKLGLTILFVAHDLSVVKYFSDRIAVMFKGKIVELATSEELFNYPLHPYTKSLLSAIPEPDPDVEKTRQRIMYDPMIHNYTVDRPQMYEVRPGHFIYANQAELKEYAKELGVKK